MLVLADLWRIKIPGMIYNLLLCLLLLYLFLSFSLNDQCPNFQSLLMYLFLCLSLKFLSPFNILFRMNTDQIKSSLELYNSNAHLPLLGSLTTLF